MPIALFLQGASLGLTAAATPGPFQAYLISQTLAGGWRRGALIAFAPLFSDAPIVAVMLLLLNRAPAGLLRGLYFAGGLFVLYLAWGLWRAWRAGAGRASAAPEAQARQRGGGLWQGVLMNALSPGPYTFWAFVNGPILLGALRQSPWHGAAFLLGFYGLMIGGSVTLAGVFHQARRLGPRVARGLMLASILILASFAGLLLYQGATYAG
jgi:threonine/homoserine/homoserine lactone efflux protein